MAQTHTVELKLEDGTVLDVWDRYTVVQDMLQPGSPFTFSLWRSTVAQASWDVIQRKVKCFVKVELRIDGAMQMNGVIEHVQPHRTRSSGCAIIISGSDLTGRLQRFDASPRVSSRDTTLAEIIAQLVDPFDVSVVIGEAGGARDVQLGRARSPRSIRHNTRRRQHIDLVHPRIGEKVWGVIQRLCAKVGYYAWVAPAGDNNLVLVIDNPVSDGETEFVFKYAESSPNVATDDTNLLESDLVISVADMPTNVFAYGHTLRGDGTPARSCGHAEGSFDTRWVADTKLYQPIHFQPENIHTPADAVRSANKQIHNGAINHKVVTGVVQGHSQNNKIYAVNSICHWTDAVADIEQDMVLTRVVFEGSRQMGSLTQLRAHPKGALNLEPER